jgi:hypothetical protein
VLVVVMLRPKMEIDQGKMEIKERQQSWDTGLEDVRLRFGVILDCLEAWLFILLPTVWDDPLYVL